MSKTAAKPKAKEKKPTEKEVLDQMLITTIGSYYRNPGGRDPYYEYHFCVEFFGVEFRFPISVQEIVAEAERDQMAKQIFKETVALIAKKVKAY